MNLKDISGNDITVEIEDVLGENVSEEETVEDAEIETDVSGGDSFLESVDSTNGYSPQTSVETEMYTEVLEASSVEIIERLDTLNGFASALLFFTVFKWVEAKLHSGVRRLSEKWKK